MSAWMRPGRLVMTTMRLATAKTSSMLWLITITGWWSLATVLSPALMTYFLVHATGARLTEKYLRGRPGFSEYQQRTSFFTPSPPRSAARRAEILYHSGPC